MRGAKPALKAIDGGLARTPAAPEHLSARAAEEWKLVASDLTRRRVLTREMSAGLAAYCIAVAAVEECQEIFSREGRIISTPSGPRQHPAAQIETKMLTLQARWAAEFGLTPASRNRAGGTPAGGEGDDPYADLGV